MEQFSNLLSAVIERLHSQGRLPEQDFIDRLERHFDTLATQLWSVYWFRPDFAYVVEELISICLEVSQKRPQYLVDRDHSRDPLSTGSDWMTSQERIGAMAYVDLWAKDFTGVEEQIPRLQELGVDYLHLMPFYQVPPGESDGGYAVSSYQQTRPDLGTMDQLEALAQTLDSGGITLVADFVFNHLAHDHLWAKKALAQDPEYRDFFLFLDQEEKEQYQHHLRDIFPQVRSGSFTWNQEIQRWIWTTFHSYQWDLNYKNPRVFVAMAREMLSLANRGIGVLRLDAVAFLWKEAGTTCENRPQARAIIAAYNALARIATPSLLFKSEAIVHPDEIIQYISPKQCQLSYNPLLMAELWEACATKETRLLAVSLEKRHQLPPHCSWINYVRCHDDIGWTFADEDASQLWINGHDHRRFLNDFYTGNFPGSFARGVGFQFNPDNGDMRICGTGASLAGLEAAASDPVAQTMALDRLTMIHGIIYAAGGIPLLYMGDEVATLNDYSYLDDPTKANDSRWIHRSRLYLDKSPARHPKGSEFYDRLVTMGQLRKKTPAFSAIALDIVHSLPRGVLAFAKSAQGQRVVVLANFAEEPRHLDQDQVAKLLGASGRGRDLLSERSLAQGAPVQLKPLDLWWIDC